MAVLRHALLSISSPATLRESELPSLPGVPARAGRGKEGAELSFLRIVNGCASKLNHQGTAGSSSCFLLPGFYSGYLVLTHSQVLTS